MTNKPNDKFQFSGDLVEDGFRLAKNISLIGKEIQALAMAFATVGNDKVSDQLFAIFEECEIYDEAIRNLVAIETSRSLQDAQKMSGAILESCLAGLKIGKKDEKD